MRKRATAQGCTGCGLRDGVIMGDTIKPADLHLKRAYEPPDWRDGRRILVDRLWPRGLSKTAAGIDEWLKELAPSTELRKWFGHDPGKWNEFRRRYRNEIEGHPEELKHLRDLARQSRVTLIYSAHDERHNDAVVLREALMQPRGSDRSQDG